MSKSSASCSDSARANKNALMREKCGRLLVLMLPQATFSTNYSKIGYARGRAFSKARRVVSVFWTIFVAMTRRGVRMTQPNKETQRIRVVQFITIGEQEYIPAPLIRITTCGLLTIEIVREATSPARSTSRCFKRPRSKLVWMGKDERSITF